MVYSRWMKDRRGKKAWIAGILTLAVLMALLGGFRYCLPATENAHTCCHETGVIATGCCDAGDAAILARNDQESLRKTNPSAAPAVGALFPPKITFSHRPAVAAAFAAGLPFSGGPPFFVLFGAFLN